MKKILKLAEEIIPLSRKQGFFLLLIISTFFQFVLFYSPVLAEEAVKNYLGQDETLVLENRGVIISENKGSKDIIIKMSSSKETSKLRETTDATSQKDNPNNNLKIGSSATINELAIFEDGETSSAERKIAFTTKEEASGPEIRVISRSVHSMTAYNSEVGQTDDSPCITANNFNVCAHGIEDTVAANFLPFGTNIRIPELFGDRIFIVRDRMNRRYTDRVDVWMLKRSDALQFGLKRATIEVIEIIEPEVKEPTKADIQKFISKI